MLEHVIPPRDLQSWQQLPVSAIANFHPIVANTVDSADYRSMLDKNPFRYFPVVQDGRRPMIVSRKEAEAAIAEKRFVHAEPAVTCLPSQTIRELQLLLVESNQQVVLLLDQPGGKVLGLVTLHDLLRAQVSLGKQEEPTF